MTARRPKRGKAPKEEEIIAANSLTPEQLEKLMAAEVKNIAKKVVEGKTLSSAEYRRLRNAVDGGGAESPAKVTSIAELVKVLGVSRQTYYAWKKLPGAPTPAANGLHDVDAWREFMREHELKGNPLELDPEDADSPKQRLVQAQAEIHEFRLSIMRGDHVPIAKVRDRWTTLVGKAIALMRAKFESELPPLLVGKEAAEIQQELARAIDDVCEILHRE